MRGPLRSLYCRSLRERQKTFAPPTMISQKMRARQGLGPVPIPRIGVATDDAGTRHVAEGKIALATPRELPSTSMTEAPGCRLVSDRPRRRLPLSVCAVQ